MRRDAPLPIRAVTFDLWLTLVWDTKELDEYWKLRRLINVHRFLKMKTGLANSLQGGVSFNAVRLAMEELNAAVRQAAGNHLDIPTQERGRMLFEILGIRFSQQEEKKMRERAGRILSESGSYSRLPYLNPEATSVIRHLKQDFDGIKNRTNLKCGQVDRNIPTNPRQVGRPEIL